ncbi:cytochrome P450 3A31 [Folsomia candida]|uniref:Cytochrome P450 3A2 n=1 Tax=Folsomia candida TaxID=158441 RepID=A0A226DEL5_FOLCA|nr:cytochrome P450 3A31 [Folsomia candida]OXA43021.1 Cytochrome P450 3A2 [Folsomia candida]
MWVIPGILVVLVTAWFLRRFMKNSNADKLSYWKQQGFTILEETISGWDIFTGKGNVTDSDIEYYKELGRRGESCGVVTELGTPILIVRDLDVVRDILIKDFDNFTDRPPFGEGNKIFNGSLFGLMGKNWRNMRSFLSPTFTSGRIRNMFSHFEKSAANLTAFIKNQQKTSSSTNFDLPVVEAMRKFSMQVITSAAFGLKVDSFHPSDEIIPMARRLFALTMSAKIRMIFVLQFPKLAKFLNVKMEDVEAVDFFWRLISTAINIRQKSGVRGNDFLQSLVDALNSKEAGDIVWSEDAAIPQAFAFIAAGFDTIANNLSAACYVLATHPEVQEELYREVEKVMQSSGDDTISYEEINGMEYIDMFVAETLRLYPSVARLDRVCTTECALPDVGKGGRARLIRKGTVIAVPADAFHKDEQYFPDPFKFDPTRFSQENKAKRSPYAYMGFGNGPRSCIGMRFALVETKVALAHIVRNFEIRPSAGTPIPAKMEKDMLGYSVGTDIRLKFIPRD